MKRIRLLLSCLVAALAFSAMLVVSAQAKDVESGPVPFHDEGKGEAELGNSYVNIKCKSHEGEGEVTTPFGGEKGFALYKGCEAVGKSAECTSTGLKAGEIKTQPLNGEIGWISKAKNEVGDLYSPTPPGTTLAVFNCGPVVGEVKVYGGVIGKVTSPLNKMSETTAQEFVEGKELKNDPTKFEGELGEHFLETEFSSLPNQKLASNQKQSDTFTNHEGDCTISKEKEKCKEKDLTEISTLEVKCTEEEVAGKKGPEKVITCNTVQRPKPEYGRCEKAKGGKYKDKNCSEAEEFKKGVAKGKYEFTAI
jgi:hypothetical protein